MSDEEHLDIDQCDKDEPGESKAAAKSAKKTADGKVAAQAKRFQDAIAEKAATDAAQKEIDAIVAGLKPDQKAKMLAAMGVVAAASTGAVITRAKYDHEATLKKLAKNFMAARAPVETNADDYDTLHYIWSYSAHLMSLHNINDPDNKVKKNAHTALLLYFRKFQHDYGLPEYVKIAPSPAASPAVSKNVSRASSAALGISFEDDEEAGAGAGLP